MQAVGVIPESRSVRLVEHPTPNITRDHEVKIRSLEVGICGTDREICAFEYGTPPQESPYLVIGHESLGEVLEVGAAVDTVRPGDLVVPSIRRPCERPECFPCRNGRQDFCVTGDFTERGIKLRHGYMSPFYVEEEKYLSVVPPHLRDVGVLAEPLTVAEKALAQLWEIQRRLPWVVSNDPTLPGKGLQAVILGAGPVGILGTMAFLTCGFRVFVYSRSPKPNPKAELVESLGAEYISSESCSADQLAERVGRIDAVYEAVGVGKISFDLLQRLGTNGIFIFTGIPAPKSAIPTEIDRIMRELVLKNQVVLGTVNADLRDFQRAVDDLGVFEKRWPDQLRAMISGRFPLNAYKELLQGRQGGIKQVISFA